VKPVRRLPPAQTRVLEYIALHRSQTRRSPTIREIGAALGIKAPTVLQHLRALEKKGYILRQVRSARGLEIVHPEWQGSPSQPPVGVEPQTKRAQMQPPFRPQDLIPVESFVSHCSRLGIETDLDRLEFYDQRALVLPAVLICPGYVPMRNVRLEINGKLEWSEIFADDLDKFSPVEVDPEIYYAAGSISYGSRDWLKGFKERGLLSFPAQQAYVSWRQRIMGRTKQREDIAVEYHAFYTPNQCWAVKAVKESIGFKLDDEAVFYSDDDWVQVGRNVTSFLQHALVHAQGAVLSQYTLPRLLDAIYDLRDALRKDARDAYAESIREGSSEKDARADRNAFIERRENDESFQIQVREALETHGYSPQSLAALRERLVYRATSTDPNHDWKEAMERIPKHLLERARGDYARAREYYEMLDDVEYVLRVLRVDLPTRDKLLTGRDNLRLCLECGERFVPRNRRQVTCGKAQCITSHKKTHKKAIRARNKKRGT
jgi:DNA-binding CsgD family transcriptional regulator